MGHREVCRATEFPSEDEMYVASAATLLITGSKKGKGAGSS